MARTAICIVAVTLMAAVAASVPAAAKISAMSGAYDGRKAKQATPVDPLPAVPVPAKKKPKKR
ncbi:MAG: hypothetical protein ABL897_03450 [Hyphomicrobium sp.]